MMWCFLLESHTFFLNIVIKFMNLQIVLAFDEYKDGFTFVLKLYYEADLVLLFQQNRWIEMFPCIIARTSTNEVISNGINGTRNGALQLVSKKCYVFTV